MVRQAMTNRIILPQRGLGEREWTRGLSLELKMHTYLSNWRGEIDDAQGHILDKIVGTGSLGHFQWRALIFSVM